MKKCKLIEVYRKTGGQRLSFTPDVEITTNSHVEDVINKYLAQGYEIQQITDTTSTTRIYFVKNV